MKPFHTFFVIATIFVSTNDPQPTQEGRSRRGVNCQSGTVAIGASVNVTCSFPIDFNTNKHNFLIERYRQCPGQNESITEDILSCNLIQYEKPNCKCIAEATYKISHDHVTVEFHNVTPDVAGQYLCHLIPPLEAGPVKPCNLTVQDATENGTVVNSTNVDQSKETTPLPEKCNCAHLEESLATVHKLIVALYIIIIIIQPITIGIVAYLYRLNKRKNRGPQAKLNASISANAVYQVRTGSTSSGDIYMAPTERSCPESGALARSCCGPMLHRESTGISQTPEVETDDSTAEH